MDTTGAGEAQSHAGTDFVDVESRRKFRPSSDGASPDGNEDAGCGHDGFGRDRELRVGRPPRLGEFGTVGKEAADRGNRLCPIEVGLTDGGHFRANLARVVAPRKLGRPAVRRGILVFKLRGQPLADRLGILDGTVVEEVREGEVWRPRLALGF